MILITTYPFDQQYVLSILQDVVELVSKNIQNNSHIKLISQDLQRNLVLVDELEFVYEH